MSEIEIFNYNNGLQKSFIFSCNERSELVFEECYRRLLQINPAMSPQICAPHVDNGNILDFSVKKHQYRKIGLILNMILKFNNNLLYNNCMIFTLDFCYKKRSIQEIILNLNWFILKLQVQLPLILQRPLNSQNLSTYETEFIQTVLNFKWDTYTNKFFINQFYLYLVFLISYVTDLYFFTINAGVADEEDSRSIVQQLVLKLTCVGYLLLQEYYEFRCQEEQVMYQLLWVLYHGFKKHLLEDFRSTTFTNGRYTHYLCLDSLDISCPLFEHYSLNFIIAVISESYEKVMQKMVAESYRIKAQLIKERESYFNDEEFKNQEYFPSYIIFRRPVEDQIDDNQEWQGFVKDIKKTIYKTHTKSINAEEQILHHVKAVELNVKAVELTVKDLQTIIKNQDSIIKSHESQNKTLQSTVNDMKSNQNEIKSTVNELKVDMKNLIQSLLKNSEDKLIEENIKEEAKEEEKILIVKNE
eukprot:403351696